MTIYYIKVYNHIMEQTACDHSSTHARLKAICAFLARYSTTLVACGATTQRATLNVVRIAKTYDTQVVLTILSNHVMITVHELNGDHTYTLTRRIRQSPINFSLNSALSRLSWKIADCNVELNHAQRMFDTLLSRHRIKIVPLTLMVGAANASFCRLFGGDLPAMLIVFIATIAGFWLKHIMTSKWHWSIYAATFICASVAALISCAPMVFGWGATPQVALATSVLFLVPGVPFINGLSDMMTAHYTCGIGRLFKAVMLTICLTGGLMVAFLCMDINML